MESRNLPQKAEWFSDDICLFMYLERQNYKKLTWIFKNSPDINPIDPSSNTNKLPGCGSLEFVM